MPHSQERWDEYFCRMMILVASKSKDPNTQHGCVIVGPSHEIRSTGFNGMPRGIHEEPPCFAKPDKKEIQKRYERPTKYLYFEHSERNAIYNAARTGIALEGCTLYVTGTPCVDCARGIIQVGINRVVVYDTSDDGFKERWKDAIVVTEQLFKEAGVKLDTFKGTINEKDLCVPSLQACALEDWF